MDLWLAWAALFTFSAGGLSLAQQQWIDGLQWVAIGCVTLTLAGLVGRPGMSQRIREMTGGHRCEHGVLRASAQHRSYAGPVYTCACCRSPYGSLGEQPEPLLCPGCSPMGDRG